MNRYCVLSAFAASIALVACTHQAIEPQGPEAAPAASAAQVEAKALLEHIRILASDAFEGRFPGTPGEEKTVAYLTEQFRTLGLAPGNPDGTYVQEVPLVGLSATPELRFEINGKPLAMRVRSDYVAGTSRFEPEITIEDSPLVFVGYGVQAPEYDWDDYKGVDVRGKTIVMLINDPAVPDPRDRSRLDDAVFKGKAMTYYGRWTYKYEIASKLGAAGAIIVHETEPAAYPWSVVQSSWSGEAFHLAEADRGAGRVAVQGWITLEQARRLFKRAGKDFDRLHAAALRRDFKPVLLPATMSARITNQVREIRSRNVVAALPGDDPVLKDEWLVYNAHWDHLGRDPARSGDQIYNGAVDNASGVAGLLELARVFAAGPVPRRSLLFIGSTAEEQGLLGTQWYAAHPLVPLERTVAMINMDSLNPWGPTREIQVIGAGQNTLEDDLHKILAARGRITAADEHPEKGGYFRSDQFNFAKVGIPALFADRGTDIVGRPDFGEAMFQAYIAKDYHQPSDEMRADWDLSGAAQDVQALHDLGFVVANRDTRPGWKEGSEFKRLRH